jgi:hypothetical protein
MPALTLSGQTKQRQIVILAVGGVLLAGLLMFQVPRTLEMLKGDEPPPASTETTATPTPTPASPAAPPGVAPVPVESSGSTPLHASLTRFTSKDPFVQQINANGGGAAPSPSASSEAPPGEGAETESPAEPGSFAAVGSSGTAPSGNAATIAVNGAEESVRVSNTFPEGNPVFKLVSLGDDTAKVGVASGKLKGGAQTVTLSKGEPLTLLNTVDGKRYRLELVSVGS